MFHNHLLIDTAAALYERTDPEYQPLRKALVSISPPSPPLPARKQLFTHAYYLQREAVFASLSTSRNDHTTFIFTEWQSSDAEGTSTAQSYLSAARSRPSPTPFISVILTCAEQANIRRLTSGDRGQRNTKLTDVAVLKTARAHSEAHRFLEDARVAMEIEVDVTGGSAEDGARAIYGAIRDSSVIRLVDG